MSAETPFMGLVVWNKPTDTWNHEQLATNFRKLDEHDHASGRGRKIPTGGIEDGAITKAKLAFNTFSLSDGVIETRHIRPRAVTNSRLDVKSVSSENLMADSVNLSKIRVGSVASSRLTETTQNMLGVHPNSRNVVKFIPGTKADDTKSVNYTVTENSTLSVPSPRTSGMTDTIKVQLPTAGFGGAFLHVYAQGKIIEPWVQMVNNEGGKVRLAPSLQIDAGSFRREFVISRREFSQAGNGSFDWFSSPGVSPNWSVAAGDNDQNVGATGGGIITQYIPGSNEINIAAQVRLSFTISGRNDKSRMRLGEQTLAVWTSTCPHGLNFAPGFPSSWSPLI